MHSLKVESRQLAPTPALDKHFESADITRMKIMFASAWQLPALLLLGLTSCGSFQSGAPDDGQVAGGVYSNSFFAFTVSLPGGWPVAPRNTLEAIQQTGNKALAQETQDKDFQRKLKTASPDSYQLLLVSEKPWGAPTDSNPSLIIAAEKASRKKGIETGKDYLVRVSRLLANSPLPYQPSGAMGETRLGGKLFHRLDFTAKIANQPLRQSYLATVERGHSLIFILSGRETEFKALEEALDSVRFQ